MASDSRRLDAQASRPLPARSLLGARIASSEQCGGGPLKAARVTNARSLPEFRLLLSVSCLSALSSIATAQICPLTRISVDSNGAQLVVGSFVPTISADGQFVMFAADFDLLPQDTNGFQDLYIVDTTSGLLELISATQTGAGGNSGTGFWRDISNDNRFVSFSSYATDLVPGLTYDMHAFVRDRRLATTRVVSVTSSGIVVDCCGIARISGDGNSVVFPSMSTLPYPGDVNQASDLFVHDLRTGSTELMSISVTDTTGLGDSGFLEGADISYDGRFVVFGSRAPDLVVGLWAPYGGVYLRDRMLGLTTMLSTGIGGQIANGRSGQAFLSDDAQIVVFMSSASNLVAGDTNGKDDIFVLDRIAGTTERLSVAALGAEANDSSGYPASSPDGRFVSFHSPASNLVPGDTNGILDVFLVDRSTHRIERLSVDANGVETNGRSLFPSLSRNAAEVVFHSEGALVPGDTNFLCDIFLRRCPVPAGYCTSKTNSLGCVPTMSTSGIPMASWPRDFYVKAQQVLNQKAGMLIYSTAGSNAVPFFGGTLCLQFPLSRTAGQHSGGSTTGTNCTGTFSFDFNALIATGANPALVPGATVWAQYWSRDPGFAAPFNSSLTNAQTFVIWP